MFQETWYMGKEEYEKEGMLPRLEEVFEKKKKARKESWWLLYSVIAW